MFYKIFATPDGARFESAERITGPGFDLDGSKAADRARTVDGWAWFDTPAAFRASSGFKSSEKALIRTALVAAGLMDDTPDDPAEWPQWAPGTYERGDKVSNRGARWVSRINANVWEAGDLSIPTHSMLWEQAIDPSELVAAGNQWRADVDYKSGDIVTFEGKTYKVLQNHKSQAGWLPSVVASLYQLQS